MGKRIRGRKGQALRAHRLQRTNHLCERCLGLNRWKGKGSGRPVPATRVNHIIPLDHGGLDEDENTENLCRPCDLIVTAEQFSFKQKVEIGADGWPIQ